MNCGGFVSHVYAKAGGDLSKIANNQSNSPWLGGPGRGSFCNAYRWYGYAIDSGATVLQFNSVSELLASGEARKGDLVFFYRLIHIRQTATSGFSGGTLLTRIASGILSVAWATASLDL